MKLKSLLVVLLAGVALSGCHRMDPNSPEAKRQAIFKEMLRTSEDMGGMLRGRLPFDAEKFRAGSVKLHQLADQPWQYFPRPKAGEEGEDTRAKDEVWQRQQEFKAATQVFIDAMNRLQDNTRQATPTPDGVRKDFAAVEDACEACHKKFRAL
ncbi:cytochrome c [Pseudomonas aeruginosa]|nr:cytochrome c [Pseudomonas aeruginosa]